MDLPKVHKVVFVVDRKDLDYQTMNEFNSFKKDSVDVTDNTHSLVKQLTDDTKLVLTTIQKLNNAITKAHYESRLQHLKDKKVVFIFDECHRISLVKPTVELPSSLLIASYLALLAHPFLQIMPLKRSGKTHHQRPLWRLPHKTLLLMPHATECTRFGVEYVGKYKNKSNTFIDIEVEDIDKAEVFNDPNRLEKIVDYILAYHDQKHFEKLTCLICCKLNR